MYLFCPPIYSIICTLITASFLNPSVRSAVLKRVYPFVSPSVYLSLFRVSVCLSVFLIGLFFPSVACKSSVGRLTDLFLVVTKRLLHSPYRRRKTSSSCKPIVSFEMSEQISVHHCQLRSGSFSLVLSSRLMRRKDKEWAKQRNTRRIRRSSGIWKLAPLLGVQLIVMEAPLNTLLQYFCSLGEVLCCVECDIFNERSWKKNIQALKSLAVLYFYISEIN